MVPTLSAVSESTNVVRAVRAASSAQREQPSKTSDLCVHYLRRNQDGRKRKVQLHTAQSARSNVKSLTRRVLAHGLMLR